MGMSPPSSHGASQPAPRGFAVSLAATTGSLPSTSTIPFDTAFYDTDAFFDLGTHIATIPAGLGGLYIVTLSVDLQLDGTTTNPVRCEIQTGGNWANLYYGIAGIPNANANAHGYCGGGVVAEYAAGDTLTPKWIGSSAFFQGSGNGCVFSVLRLNDAP